MLHTVADAEGGEEEKVEQNINTSLK
jgi:hypothetical protein